MKNRWTRTKMTILMLTTAACMPQIGNCLSDRQLTSILETVITTGLTTFVNTVVANVATQT